MYAAATQLVGVLAMAVCISSFQCKNSRTLILVQTLGNALFVLQFLMLGAFSGCASLVVLCLGNLVLCVEKPWAKRAGWKWVFSGLVLVSCLVTWTDRFSIFPCASSLVWLLSNWSRNGKMIRLCKLTLVGPGWLLYNFHVHAWPGLISESIGMLSALWSIRRYGLEALNQKT